MPQPLVAQWGRLEVGLARGISGVRGSILRWAREAQGLSIDEAAAKIGRPADELKAWESEDDEASPTYPQLERLAYKIYKRPLATFFLPQPPTEARVEERFRTLPDFDLRHLLPDTRYQLRLARSLQLSLEELTNGTNPAVRKIFDDVNLDRSMPSETAAERIREYLGIALATQRSWKNVEEALKNWRAAVEDVGVFVFKNTFKQREISAFCLTHDEFPIVYLNNSTPKTRQIFSLFHELCHLLMHADSISKVDQTYIASLGVEERAAERFCNAVTADVLIPSADFRDQIGDTHTFDDDKISALASRYLVSREAVLRRLLDLKLVSQDFYEHKAKQWADEAVANATHPGGNYFATQATYLGPTYLRLVFSRYYQNAIGIEQVADFLGVKTANVPGIEASAAGSLAP